MSTENQHFAEDDEKGIPESWCPLGPAPRRRGLEFTSNEGSELCATGNNRIITSSEHKTEKNYACKHEKFEKSANSLAHLVWGWETYADEDAGNVHVRHKRDSFQPLQMLQNLSLCGAGESFGVSHINGHPPVSRKGTIDPPPNEDPFESIVLRHSHSSPIRYSTMFDSNPSPPPVGFDRMRRSISTPSSSAFKQRNACSSRGWQLGAMYCPGDQDDRSAFSLPIQQKSFNSSPRNAGVHHSAFDPVPVTATVLETNEATSIEVMDLATPVGESVKETLTEQPVNKPKTAPSRTARFLADMRMLRRKRSRRGAGDKPGIPPLSFSPSRTYKPRKACNVEEPVAGHRRDPILAYSRVSGQCSGSGEGGRGRLSDEVESFISHDSDDEEMVSPDNGLSDSAVGNYHQLDSDVDEEYEHYQRMEASVQTESPITVPSPAYHQFLDEQIDQPLETEGHVPEPGTLDPTVRTKVSNAAKAPEKSAIGARTVSADVATSHPGPTLRRDGDRNSTTPTSQDSGAQSAETVRSTTTNYTSGHTTQATSTSVTVSSGQITVLSSVNEEADREVMETNQAGKLRRQRHRTVTARGRDGNGSLHSSSSVSTQSHGYLSLSGSPSPLREGACLPIERFFSQPAIPHSSLRTSSSGKDAGAGSSDIENGGELHLFAASQLASIQQKKLGGPESPVTVSSASVGNTSSVSNGEEPPKFVSYLDRNPSSDMRPPDLRLKTFGCLRDDVEVVDRRESPSMILGYSEVVFEESKMQGEPPSTESQPIHQSRKRHIEKVRFSKLACRPPRSPMKLGSKTPTTPPPPPPRPGSISPAYQQLSPPRNIFDPSTPYNMHRRRKGNLSRPHVFRTAACSSRDMSTKLVILDPEAGVTGACRSPHQRVTLSSQVHRSISHAAGEDGNYGVHEYDMAQASLPRTVNQESCVTRGEVVESNSTSCFQSNSLLFGVGNPEHMHAGENASSRIDVMATAEISPDIGAT